MTPEKLYEIYGKLMIQQEILNSQIVDIKKRISADLNKLQQQQSTPQPEGDNANPKASE
jgi:hypothetical protein